MRAEVIGIGDEILLGDISNDNARWISQRLAAVGVDVERHQAVRDVVEDVADAIRTALDRVDVVVVTGGLGPTGDDLTRDGIALATGRRLRREPEIEGWLRKRFEGMRREMPESNLVQADVPEGARWITPERGTAPGLILELQGDRFLCALPGVPAEMREMMEGTVLSELEKRSGGTTIVTRTLRTIGLPEARVGELLEDVYRAEGGPRVAFLASEGEVRVKLTAPAGSPEEAERILGPVAEEVRRRLGVAVFGTDDELLEEVIGGRMRERQEWLACAESLTGGALASRIVAVRDASKHFRGGAVVYAPDSKREILGVPQEVIDGPGTVSEECAIALARGARLRFEASVGVSTTGVAGPEPLEGKKPGTIWVGLSSEGLERARGFVAPGDRDQVRRWAVQGALSLLWRYLNDALD
ncbi:MAG TPA: competence/damage-inducible protein A [Actinomycetota bacterium]|nr:competence/damage-inducible protein A [Actinomycetota bacterium]